MVDELKEAPGAETDLKLIVPTVKLEMLADEMVAWVMVAPLEVTVMT